MLQRHMFISLITLALILGVGGASARAVEIGPGFVLAVENEYLGLYIHRDTTEIAVHVKSGNTVWYSNPNGRETLEKIGSATIKQELNAQFAFTYSDGRYTLNNYADSVLHQQYEIIQIPNGVRIEYTVGKRYNSEHMVPPMVRQDRFERIILDSIADPKDRQRVEDAYILVSLERMDGTERIPLAGLDMDRLFGDYRLVFHDPAFQSLEAELADLNARIADLQEANGEDQAELAGLIRQRDNIYNRLARDTQTTANHMLELIRDRRADVEKVSDLTFADLSQLVETPTYVLRRIAGFLQRELQRIIEASDYTFEDVRDDCWANNLDRPAYNTHVFSVPLEYLLDGANLIARVPVSEIIYPQPLSAQERQQLIEEKTKLVDQLLELNNQLNRHIRDNKDGLVLLVDRRYQALTAQIEELTREIAEFEDAYQQARPNLPLLTFTLLPYFGAAYLDQEGYIFVPDGSGALIHLNNGKTTASIYSQPVYGDDLSLGPREMPIARTQNHLPVFGLKQGSQAFLAVIEEGEALARIQADIAGKLHSYNVVYPQFTLRPSVMSIVRRYQSRMYQGDIRVRYVFLEGEDADYVGMAHAYQDYLRREFGLQPLPKHEHIPFFLDMIGAINVNRPILGIAWEVTEPLTTYQQAGQILTALEASGIKTVSLRYLGCLEDGIKHVYPAEARLEKVLGKLSELESLAERLNASNGRLYLGVNFINVYPRTFYRGFRPTKDGARFLDGLLAKNYSYDAATGRYRPDDYRFILSPKVLEPLVDSFFASLKVDKISGVAPLEMGLQVNSDFRSAADQTVDRQQAVGIVGDVLRKMKETYEANLIVEGANAYALPYADAVVQMPMDSTNYNIVDETVPFYQIVLHGFVDYTGRPINLAGDDPVYKLKLVETGALPYYQWSFADSTAVKGTEYEHLYSLHYGDWLADAGSFYAAADAVLGPVRAERIVDHRQVAENVYMTVYENGAAILVNYNRAPVEIDGVRVEALGFRLVWGSGE
jgi:hypothetical protein